MSAHPTHRGAAAIGLLREMDNVEANAVRFLRLWYDGPEAQASVWNALATSLGTRHARSALRSFEELCALCAQHGRRPLMRHSVGCTCLGGDEACFAHIVCSAAEGAPEDAFLLAVNIVRPDVAAAVVSLAQEFGLALRRMTAINDPSLPPLQAGPAPDRSKLH